MPVRIREFDFPRDYETVRALWEDIEKGVRLGRSDTPGEIQKKLQRDPELFLVAENAGEIIGTVIGGYDGRRGLLYHLAVAAGHRQQGVGEGLLMEVEKRLRARGCIRCYLLVTNDNLEAARFYEKRGWKSMDYLSAFGKDLQ
jgi:ribosomal protein S18 acetylase RimI-like enzyme